MGELALAFGRPEARPTGWPARAGRPTALWVDPGGSIGTAEEAICFVVALDVSGGGVPLERSSELHRHVRENAARGRDVSLFDIGDGLAARVDRGQKILHVIADGRRDVLLDLRLGVVFGNFLQFP